MTKRFCLQDSQVWQHLVTLALGSRSLPKSSDEARNGHLDHVSTPATLITPPTPRSPHSPTTLSYLSPCPPLRAAALPLAAPPASASAPPNPSPRLLPPLRAFLTVGRTLEAVLRHFRLHARPRARVLRRLPALVLSVNETQRPRACAPQPSAGSPPL